MNPEAASPDPHQVAASAWLLLEAYGGVWARADIQRELGVSRGRVAELTRQTHFPAPIGEVGGRPVWLAVDVQAYRRDPPTRWTHRSAGESDQTDRGA